MSTFFNVYQEIAEKRYEMKKYDAKTWSRCLQAASSSLFLTSMLLLAACGGTAPGTPASRQAPSFATRADAFLSQEVDNRMFSGMALVTQNGRVLWSRGYSMANNPASPG